MSILLATVFLLVRLIINTVIFVNFCSSLTMKMIIVANMKEVGVTFMK